MIYFELAVDSTQIPTEEKLVKDFYSHSYNDDYLTGVKLDALVYAASQALEIWEIPRIRIEDDGGYNRLFVLEFSHAGKKVLGRVALRNARQPSRIDAAVATMSFARHVRGIPTPEIYAWNSREDNPVGAPYIIQEFVDNVVHSWVAFKVSSTESQYSTALDDFARWHAEFLTPMPPHLNGIGDLAFARGVDPETADLTDPNSYVLIPIRIRLERPSFTAQKSFQATTTSVAGLWEELWTRRRDMCFLTPRQSDTSHFSDAVVDLEEVGLDEDSSEEERMQCSPHALATTAEHARTFIHRALSRFHTSPPQYSASCLVRADYAFRNILIDPATFRVRAFIDWDDVYVAPLVLSINFPEDFEVFMTAGLPPDALFYQEGAFSCIPPDEYGEIIGPIDKDGNFTRVDEHGNPTYIGERDVRIESTKKREDYVQALSKYDDRVKQEDMWALRKEMLKANELVQRGGQAWWSRRKWLAAQAGAAEIE